MKDLLDRYLAAVARDLPGAQRTDIIAELRDELLTEIELKEEAAGRPLDIAELEAVLHEFGHPLVVAGRYRRVQHLVGPEVFPMWWSALRITLGVIAGIYLVVAVLRAAYVPGDGDLDLVRIPSLITALLTAFGAVTVVAVVLERLNLHRFLYRWKPRQLPPAGVKTTTPFERVVEIGMEVVFLLWWTGIIHFRDWISTPGPLTLELAPVFQAWFWPVIAFSTFELVVNVIGLLRAGWTHVNAALSLVRSMAGLTIAAGLLQASTWIVVGSDRLSPAALESVQRNFDAGFKLGLVVTVAGLAIKVAIDAWRLWRVTQDAGAPFTARAA